MTSNVAKDEHRWPALPMEQWKDTCATLHMWTQIVGKVRLALTPLINHWWNVPLYVNARGLTTSAIPYRHRPFELCFDFLDQQLVLQMSDGTSKAFPLSAMSVADFYEKVMGMLQSSGIEVKIWHMPVEVADPIPFDQDRVHASYDPEAAQRFWRILLSVQCVFEEFRSRFVGKCSPIHFFWGSFDLAVTRFSGRPAPERSGVDRITREAYSHEVSSVGFWPGGGTVSGPAFYSYSAPEPPGVPGLAGSPRSGALRCAAQRVPPYVRRCANFRFSKCSIAGFLSIHLRSGSQSGQMGSQRARKAGRSNSSEERLIALLLS